MKKITLPLLLVSLLLGTSCKSEHTSSSTNSNVNNFNSSQEVIIKSPNEDGGLEGNADNDTVEKQDDSILKEFLLDVSSEKYFSYEVASTVSGSETHFINYFTPYAWYEENDNPSLSFGYAQEKDTEAVFKYYIEDENIAIPSIYEYTGYNDDVSKLTELYSPLTLTHVNLFNEDNMADFSAISYGVNKFLITDSNTASIFQFMTTFGTSITDYIVATYIEILDIEGLKFKSICDLGDYGTIEGIFTPTKDLKNAFVNEMIEDGVFKGIEYHEDVYEFLNNKISTNNYILRGIKQQSNSDYESIYPYIIHCTNDYFYLEYNEKFLKTLSESDRKKYSNYGYAMIPKNTPITYYELQENGTYLEKTQTLSYTSCYGFKQKEDGTFFFDFFKGPLENSGLEYREVDSLPETGEEGKLYIIEEAGKKVAYEYRETTNGMDYVFYSNWFNSVGDFYINDSIATFYLSGTALSSIGALYFEKSLTQEDEYFSNNITILGALANGLFGWGFQQTDTWMDYVKNSKIRINRNADNEITSYDIGLDIMAKVNGSEAGLNEISYTIDSFGEGNVQSVEDFLATTLGGI